MNPTTPADDRNHPSLTTIVNEVAALAKREDRVKVADIIETLGRASSAALIFIPALIATTPLSGIPGLSAFCGVAIALISAQAAVGRHRLWLPDFMMRRAVKGDKLAAGLSKVRKPLEFLDRHTHARLSFLTRGPGARLLFVLCMLAGLTMPVLELIPFSASAIAACISLLMVAILTLDGALVVTAAGLATGITLLITTLI
jgi:hypothetical protein